MIPSFDTSMRDGKRYKPKIQIIEVKDRMNRRDTPIARLMVERVETPHYYFDGNKTAIEYVLLDLVYEYLTDDPRPMPFNRYSFHAKFRAGWKDAGSIDLTGGFVVVDPSSMHGQRIGTYLFNEVIDWAKQWPDAVITPIKLVETDQVNKIRRNHFYARFGFSFDFKDDDCQVGVSRHLHVRDLNLVDSWQKNITEINVQEFLMREVFDHKRIKDEIDRIACVNKSVWTENEWHYQNPIQFMFKTLYKRYFLIWCAYSVFGLLVFLVGRDILKKLST